LKSTTSNSPCPMCGQKIKEDKSEIECAYCGFYFTPIPEEELLEGERNFLSVQEKYSNWQRYECSIVSRC